MTTPTPSDFRALCKELHEALECRCESMEDERLLDRSAAALRAALEAQPEPVGATKAELRQLFDDQSGYINDEQVMWWADFHKAVRAAFARWGRSAALPVPVSERPWEREGWCDGDDTCWAIGQRDSWVRVYVPDRDWSNPAYTHLLPAHALPIPRSEEI